jgi:hypothetical protein
MFVTRTTQPFGAGSVSLQIPLAPEHATFSAPFRRKGKELTKRIIASSEKCVGI